MTMGKRSSRCWVKRKKRFPNARCVNVPMKKSTSKSSSNAQIRIKCCATAGEHHSASHWDFSNYNTLHSVNFAYTNQVIHNETKMGITTKTPVTILFFKIFNIALKAYLHCIGSDDDSCFFLIFFIQYKFQTYFINFPFVCFQNNGF